METLRIISSNSPSIRRGELDLGLLAQACSANGAGINITIASSDCGEYDLWIANVNHTSAVPLEGAVEEFKAFFRDGRTKARDHLIVTFFLGIDTADQDQILRPTFISVCRRKLAERESVSDDDQSFSSIDEKTEEDNPLILSKHTIASRKSKSKTRVSILSAIAFFGIATIGIFLYLSSKPTQYERYPTPGSNGPKHQSRLLYNNATSWARQVDFDDKKWRIRIDDQALVPAHLYNADEERYQKWFRQRYPHLQDIVERHDYLRPSWLGSSQISVPWDEQFHFAHCVLALRRYWIAKETGTHVCGRDIDHAHMKHCLDSLDEKAFPPGPMKDVGKGYRLWWQTKVCYD